MKKIPATLIPGDGIGPEIIDATLKVLKVLDAPFEWEQQLAGVAAEEAMGEPLPEARNLIKKIINGRNPEQRILKPA